MERNVTNDAFFLQAKFTLLLKLLGVEIWVEDFLIVSKVGDRSRGRPEGCLLNSYYTEV